MGACVQGGSWPSQPGKHLLPQLHHPVSHLHPATCQLLTVKGAQPCLWVLNSFVKSSCFEHGFKTPVCVSGHQSGFCMICVMQNHIIQAFANTSNAIKPVSFIRDLKSKISLNTVSLSDDWVLMQVVSGVCNILVWVQPWRVLWRNNVSHMRKSSSNCST